MERIVAEQERLGFEDRYGDRRGWWMESPKNDPASGEKRRNSADVAERDEESLVAFMDSECESRVGGGRSERAWEAMSHSLSLLSILSLHPHSVFFSPLY